MKFLKKNMILNSRHGGATISFMSSCKVDGG